ncbi:MAG: aspartate-semialdehyde dehydrogenase [Candidatus Aminicenantales bacterium]
MKRLKVAVMGCTGLVGQQFVRMLDGHPFFELSVLTSSSRSAGKKYAAAINWAGKEDLSDAAAGMEVRETSVEALLESGVKIVFSAVPAFVAEKIEPVLRRNGLFIFSNASTHRMDEDVPILIPEINPDHLEIVHRQVSRHKGFIVTNSNCSTSGLVMGLKPLEPFGIRAVTVATYQSISGAGRRGLPAMDIAANVIPFIRKEEEKMEKESKKILGRFTGEKIVAHEMSVRASCCRVPVREGHLMSVGMEFVEDIETRAVEIALSTFRGVPQEMELPTAPDRPVIVRPEEDRPQPVLDVHAGSPERARGMAVTAGRIRKKGRFISLFLLVHNTVRGAAGTCLLNAELALRKNIIT